MSAIHFPNCRNPHSQTLKTGEGRWGIKKDTQIFTKRKLGPGGTPISDGGTMTQS